MLDRRQLILDAAMVDAAYVGRFVGSLTTADETVALTAIRCMISYFSLFVYESYERLKRLDPQVARQIAVSPNVARAIARSRHSLKLFENTNRRVEGQLAYFRDEIIAAHRGNFIENIRPPFLKRFGNDLGISTYDGMLVSTTHAEAFAFGVDPLISAAKDSGSMFRDNAIEYGQYFACWGAVVDREAISFPNRMSGDLLHADDIRSEMMYGRQFNGSSTPEINAWLSVFQASLNTLDKLLSLDTDPASVQTTLKIKYLSIYHIIQSLRILLDERAAELESRSKDAINSILAHPAARIITHSAARPFRNTLMHYGSDPRSDLSQLGLGKPLYGLVEQCFSMDLMSFDGLLTTLIAETASAMNVWALLDSEP
jgi:hypothetical protein